MGDSDPTQSVTSRAYIATPTLRSTLPKLILPSLLLALFIFDLSQRDWDFSSPLSLVGGKRFYLAAVLGMTIAPGLQD